MRTSKSRLNMFTSKSLRKKCCEARCILDGITVEAELNHFDHVLEMNGNGGRTLSAGPNTLFDSLQPSRSPE